MDKVSGLDRSITNILNTLSNEFDPDRNIVHRRLLQQKLREFKDTLDNFGQYPPADDEEFFVTVNTSVQQLNKIANELTNHQSTELEYLESITYMYVLLNIMTQRQVIGDVFRKYSVANILMNILSENVGVRSLPSDLEVTNFNDFKRVRVYFNALNTVVSMYTSLFNILPVMNEVDVINWIKQSVRHVIMSEELLRQVDLEIIYENRHEWEVNFYRLVGAWNNPMIAKFQLLLALQRIFGENWPEDGGEILVGHGINGFLQTVKDVIKRSTALTNLGRSKLKNDDNLSLRNKHSAYLERIELQTERFAKLVRRYELFSLIDYSDKLKTGQLSLNQIKVIAKETDETLKQYIDLLPQGLELANSSSAEVYGNIFKDLIVVKSLETIMKRDLSVIDEFHKKYSHILQGKMVDVIPSIKYTNLLSTIFCHTYLGLDLNEHWVEDLNELIEVFETSPHHFANLLLLKTIVSKITGKINSIQFSESLDNIRSYLQEQGFDKLSHLYQRYLEHIENFSIIGDLILNQLNHIDYYSWLIPDFTDYGIGYIPINLHYFRVN